MNDNYLTVTALTKYIKRKIDSDHHLNEIWLMGEISNFKHHSRGHMYFTIKDDHARIQAVMFAGKNRYLKFTPENGMKVLIRGEVSVFVAFGQYQLYINRMEPDGIGSLFLAFEQLKEKLGKQGLFDVDHKLPIPAYPRHIGVITSPTGAAVRDIITTIQRRYPIVQTTILPVLVQGEFAADSIVRAIHKANELKLFDVLIVGRGGGSIEELWGFNEEKVAKAMFASNIPIISAVGHETDHTISDFVADLRAATPTGAAEIAVPSQQDLLEKLSASEQRLARTIKHTIHLSNHKLQRLNESYAFRYPEQIIKQRELEIDQLMEKMEKSMASQLKLHSQQMSHLYTRLLAQSPLKQLDESRASFKRLMKLFSKTFNDTLEQKSAKLSRTMEKLVLLNPLEVMKRGFAIPYSSEGVLIKSKLQVSSNDLIHVELTDGKINCQVIEVEEK